VRVELAALPRAERSRALSDVYAGLRDSLDLGAGPVVASAWLDRGPAEAPLWLVVIHHLVVDGVSWRILVDDLGEACSRIARSGKIEPPPKTTSYGAWAERLAEHATSDALEEARRYWRSALPERTPRLPSGEEGGRAGAGGGGLHGHLDSETTARLLRDVPRAYGTRVDEVLLTALAISWRRRAGAGPVQVDVETHGREEIWPDVDLSRTVGWFTTFHPLAVELDDPDDVGAALVTVKERLRRMPNGGLDYGVLRYLAPSADGEDWPTSDAVFNYLGQVDAGVASDAVLRRSRESPGGDAAGSPAAPLGYALVVNGGIVDGALETVWIFDRQRLGHDVVTDLMEGFFEALRAIVAHCTTPGVGEVTPSDFRRVALEQDELDAIASELERD
jgi:non-ribosomal peptide synthase protein (TIGR01720 family)